MRLLPKASAKQWFTVLKGIYTTAQQRNIGLIAAGVAFYGMLALFPTLAAIVSLWGAMADPLVVEQQLKLLVDFIPPDAFQLIDQQVKDLTDEKNNTFSLTGTLSLLLAIWSTRAGTTALIKGLNTVYREPNRRGVKSFLLGFTFAVSLVFVALIAIAAVVLMPVILALLPLGTFTTFALSTGRWIIIVAILIITLGVIYRYGPNRKRDQIPWITPGAIIVVFVWGAASIAFSNYLSNFTNYNETYGSLGAAVALLMWFFISAYLILLGAALNVELEKRIQQQSNKLEAETKAEQIPTTKEDTITLDKKPQT